MIVDTTATIVTLDSFLLHYSE